ncbi:MAG: hypothetical protein IKM90_05005 [Bacteroidaceae bacterium]|nr:hypothetical protein [Bacteroidaceae bacterium]
MRSNNRNGLTLLFLMLTISTFAWGADITDVTGLTGINGSSDTFVIKNDIDVSNGFSTIASFSGTLEADINPQTHMPYRIMNLGVPLFTTLTGTVRNLVLEDVNISGNTGNTGAIACEASGDNARIYNVGILSGSVGGTGNTGGLVGQISNKARVINCYSFATITGGTTVGGIVGNNNATTTASSFNTMVMNCMFYGDITGGTNKSPVYGGTNISNLNSGGLTTFNYYAYEQLPTSHITSGKYNCALAVEEKFLNRFEFYRLLLNSNKKLSAFYVTGAPADANKMLKWVLETADRTIDDPKPYPILKAQGYYPSIVNPDFDNAPDSATVGRNHGGKLGRTLSVTISGIKTDGGQTWPAGASITTGSFSLTRTDKDFDRFNYNYDKVQLPYYNDVGTGNYTGNRVVTGWKITAINAVNGDPYTSANYDYTKTFADNYFDYPNYNFADRKSSNKDLYTVSKRVFSQGAYFDVPYGVTSITIEPYWAKAVYISDPYYDAVYNTGYTKQEVGNTGTQVKVGTTFFDGEVLGTTAQLGAAAQRIENTVGNALKYINDNLGGYGPTVYDNAVVLVGNLHQNGIPSNGTNPFTLMSVDINHDNEPDYSMIYHHSGKLRVAPIRFDFLNVPGTAQAQKPNGASNILNMAIIHPSAWFEITNTSSIYFSQLEYEDLVDNASRTEGPLILQGGVIDQFVSTNNSKVNGKTIYMHLGGNVWFKEFNMGTHGDGNNSTPHPPVSVTGGDYDAFYLTGIYNQDAAMRTDNAECYISGGHFKEAAGTGQEAIGGNVRWQIYNADIDNFYGGGTNGATGKNIKGNVTVDIFNSHVTTYCGGPKFGNMESGKKVTTNADGCVFGTFFGAGFGGTAYSRKKYYDKDDNPVNWTTQQGNYTRDRGKYFDGTNASGNALGQNGKYGYKGIGVATDFDYEYFVWSSGKTGGRFYVKFASFSLAQCNEVESKLKHCTIENNFYGGGNLGKVVGTVTSELDNCTVKGNVFGAGFSASLPTLEVRNEGFTTAPNYNSASGMFEPGVFSGTTTFSWKNAAEAGVTLSNGQSGSDLNTNHYIYTNQDLRTSNLGSVDGDVNLTLKGDTKVGTLQGNNVLTGTGNVFGGGESSWVTGASHTVTVLLQDGTTVYGNVFGGGDQGNVEGSTEVNIE